MDLAIALRFAGLFTFLRIDATPDTIALSFLLAIL
jgi:hypothetical protein